MNNQIEESIKESDIKRKGFLDLCNLLKKHKEKVTMGDLIKEVTEEGWYDDFMRIGYNSIIRQVNKHNSKFKNTTIHPFK